LKINDDMTKRVVSKLIDSHWVNSRSEGVTRRLLDREAAEHGRATSVVRYAPASRFYEHTHECVEEFLVLDGSFSDEYGDYPAGTYVRNPVGSRHSPLSQKGCTLFVKLHHFSCDDGQRIVIDTSKRNWHPGLVDGLSVMPLHSYGTEQTALVRWDKGTYFQPHRHWGGEEIYVLDGTFEDEHGSYPSDTWLRSPHLSAHRPFSKQGCTIFVKTGHLAGVTQTL
jgi:anti-sigma factor ChrR (cupin superfamily)